MMPYCLSCFLQTAGNPAAPESEGASEVKDTGTDVNTEDKDVSAEDNHGEVQKPDVPADRQDTSCNINELMLLLQRVQSVSPKGGLQ